MMKRKQFIIIGLLLLLVGGVYNKAFAAWLDNVPVTVVQPNGDTLHLFATGDEFYHYLHDREGYTVVQHPETGYYVYADKVNDILVPTQFVVGRSKPKYSIGQQRLTISYEEYLRKRLILEGDNPYKVLPNRNSNSNHGNVNHIVIFISFADDPIVSTKNFAEVDNMFNATESGARSVYNYFKTVSYDKINIMTTFYPSPDNNQIRCYVDSFVRDYYSPYNVITNPLGYHDVTEGIARRERLLTNAIQYVNDNFPIPSDLDLDYDEDGYVDVITFAVNSAEDGHGDLLWPLKSKFDDNIETKINGKTPHLFTFELLKSWYFYLNVFCHELNHVFGAPDFYHGFGIDDYPDNPDPLGKWDVMCNNHDDGTGNKTPNPSAYIKWKYLNWIDDIPTITEPGTYVLRTLGSHETQNAYKIPSSVPNQYYVLEYRDNNEFFDENVYGTGLVIYRVNEDYSGNYNAYPAHGVYDELYVFRPDGTVTENGRLNQAFFSSTSGRVSFNQGTNPQPTLSDGTADRSIVISDIYENLSAISFTYGYKIEVSTNNEQAGAVTGGGLFAYNSTCTLTATPNPGYIFNGWYTPAGLFPINPLPTFTFTVSSNMHLIAKFLAANDNIVFADALVKTLCVNNWDTNGDGELSYSEAAAVTELGQVFAYNSEITSFEELQYFTGLTTIDENAFCSCSGLTGSLIIPSSVTSIGNFAFWRCSGLTGSLIIPNSVTTIGRLAFRECAGFTGELIIPSSVTTIGDQAFSSCSGLTGDLVIPNSVTTLDEYAFNNCSSLSSIVFSNSQVSISGHVCQGCSSITSITIPSSVTSIGFGAFDGCNSLTVVNYSGNLTQWCNIQIGTGGCLFNPFDLFIDGELLTNLVIPETITEIKDYAFYNCRSLSYLTIPDAVTSIGNYAFLGCSELTTVVIGAGVTTIGNRAFFGCPALQTVYFNAVNCTSMFSEVYSGIGYSWYHYSVFSSDNDGSSPNLTYVHFGNGVQSIPDYAFKYCSSLASIEIPDSVVSIGAEAFLDCSNVSGELVLPNSLTSIGTCAFYNCSGLIGNLVLPVSVASIGTYAFWACSNITSLSLLSEAPPSLSGEIGLPSATPIYVLCGLVDAYQSAAVWSDYSNIIGMCSPSMISVTAEPNDGGMVSGAGTYNVGTVCIVAATANDGYSFVNWTENGSVISTNCVYSFLATIDRDLMAVFVSSESIVFADSTVKAICVANWDINDDGELSYAEAALVTDLGQAFSGNTDITSFEELQFFTGLLSICDNAFNNCTNLTGALRIPNSVVTIGGGAFYNCSGLAGELTIPSSVTSIGSNAFRGCGGFTGLLTIPSSVTSIGDNAFRDCGGFGGELYLPSSLTSIGASAFRDCSGFTSLFIGFSGTTLEEYAFYHCLGLTSLTLGPSVNALMARSLSFCDGLRSIQVLAETPPSVDFQVFYGNMPMGLPVYVPCNAVEAYQTANGWSSFTNIRGMCGQAIITVVKNISEGGTVTGDGTYEGGSLCSLTATANEGYTFVGWAESGAYFNYKTDYSFYVINDRAIVAVFIKENIPEGNISFADANVKARCVTHWDTDGDGELSYVEAAKVTNLGSVFSGSSQITTFEELQFFTGLKEIGSHAFDGCSNLTGSLKIPNTVTYIGWAAFAACRRLSGSLVIPKSVTKIERDAFWCCSGFTGSLVIPDAVSFIGTDAFYNSGFSGELTIPSSVKQIGDNAFAFDGVGITSVFYTGDLVHWCNIDLGYFCFGDYELFINDELLTDLGIPEAITTIKLNTFCGLKSLRYLTIPAGVTMMVSFAYGNTPFAGCSGLEQIVVMEGNSLYDSRDNCNAIIETGSNTLLVGCKNTVIPESVTSIGDFAFYGCNEMMGALILPENLTSIGKSAFEQCSRLTSVTIPGTVTSIGSHAFTNCRGLSSIEIPNAVTTIGSYAFEYCTGLTFASIGNSVSSIGISAFAGCLRLAAITVLADAPPAISDPSCPFDFAFYEVSKYIPVFVPCESVLYYQRAIQWSDFANIMGMCSTDTISVTTNPVDGGVVTGAGVYTIGMVCTLTAIPNEGYSFYYWSEDGNEISTDVSYSFVVTSDRDLIAVFGPPITITTVLDPAEGGVVTGAGVYPYGAICSLNAYANDGHVFINWVRDGVVLSGTSTYSFTVTESIEIQAVFMLVEGALVGEGDTTSLCLPSHSQFKYTLSQQIYTQEELDGSKVINSIAFFNTGDANTRFYDIYLVQTNMCAFDRNADWIPVSESDRVFRGSVMMVQNNWTNIVLDKPFVYDGVSNLAIVIDDNTGNYSASTLMQCRAFKTNDNQAICVYNNAPNYDPSIPVSYEGTLLPVKNQIIFNMELEVSQITTFNPGLTWWSPMVMAPNLLDQFEQCVSVDGVLVNSQYSGFVQNENGVWNGTLGAVLPGQMYKIQTTAACEISLNGTLVNPTDYPITIQPDWNWIGFPSPVQMSVSSALSNLSPEEGDVIKGQSAYAIYYTGYGWFPPDMQLTPGSGYLYKSNSVEEKTFIIANGREIKSQPIGTHWNRQSEGCITNTSVTAVVLVDGEEMRGESIELGAFVNGVCRGSAQLAYFAPTDRWYAMLSIAANKDEQVDFAVIDKSKGKVNTNCGLRLNINGNTMVGSLDDPCPIRFGVMNAGH